MSFKTMTLLTLVVALSRTLAQVGEQAVYFPDEQMIINLTNKLAVPDQTANRYESYVDGIISNGIAKLSLEINKALIQQEGRHDRDNIVFAPVSIAGALALILLGSNGKTFEELSTVLGLTTGVNNIMAKSLEVHEQFGRMITKLERTSGFNRGHQVNFAAAVFVQKNYPVRDVYVSTAKSLYQSEVHSVDFSGNPGNAQELINGWVAQRTNGKIKNILGDEPSPDTKVIIASAMYFKALWEYPFFEGTTTKRPFYTNGRKSPTNIETEMMANGGTFPYFRDETLSCEILGLPYKGNSSVMYVVMPFDSNARRLQEFETSLQQQDLVRLADSTSYTRAVLLFPKMKIESTIDLKTTLRMLGVKSLFIPSQANLALISPGERLPVSFNRFSMSDDVFTDAAASNTGNIKTTRRKIRAAETIDNLRTIINQQSADSTYQNPGLYADKVIHKVYMDITETGTEAAASTSISLSRDGGRVTFRVDVPFLFFIRNEETKTILFWGSVTKPTPNFKRSV